MTTFSNSAPKNAAFLVYINGIEVPATRVNLRYGVWQIPECQVSMVPDPVLTRLGFEDRVQLQVFFLDDTKVDASVPPTFRLFFDGEITGWGYQTTSSGRAITFTAVNQIAIFTQLFVQFLTTFDDLVGHATLAGAGADDKGVPSSEIVFPFSLFKQGIVPASSSFLQKTVGTIASIGATAAGVTNAGNTALAVDTNSIRTPFDFLYNVVRNMIGAQVPIDQQTIPAANFFSRWVRLTNFHNRFVASPFFDDVSFSDNANVFPVLRALQSVSAVDTIARNLIPQVQNKGSIWDTLQGVYQTVLMEVAMIPSMPLVTVSLNTNLIQQTNFGEHVLEKQGSSVGGAASAVLTALTTGSVAAGVQAAQAWVSPISADSRKLRPKRIPSYFAKPQFLFGIPPACNVVFPSQLKTMAYEETYATQPTRIYFNDETLINLFKIGKTGFGQTVHNQLSIAYPPEADAALKARIDGGGKFTGKNILLYPEEFFKGPVLDRRDVPPWLFFLKAGEIDKKTKDGKTGDNTPAATARPSQTARVPRPAPAGAPAGTMVTNGRVGVAGPNGTRTFNSTVEALRGKVSQVAMANGIPTDFLLAWISHESNGDNTATDPGGHASDPNFTGARGLFQFNQSNLAAVGVSTTQFPSVSTDPDLALSTGVKVIASYRQTANAIAQANGLSWSEGDMWRLTKMYFNAPAALTRTSAGDIPTLKGAIAALGHPPASWAELFPQVNPGDSRNAWGNATSVGGVVASASGTMTTASDPNPFTAPGATAAPVTGEAAAKGPSSAASSTPAVDQTAYADVREIEDVYHLYAKYEFFRERFARRSGSAQLAWDPFVVPGYPMMIFDHRSSRVDLMCYVTTVQQSMSATGERSTTVSFLYGRQLQEVFELLAQAFENGSASAGAGPAEPIRDIRKIIQSFAQAESYYQQLFYGAQPLFNKDASFDFRKIVGYAPEVQNGTPLTIFVDGPEEAAQDDLNQAKINYAGLLETRLRVTTQIGVLQSQRTTNQNILTETSPDTVSTPSEAQIQQRQEAQQVLLDIANQLPVLQQQLSTIDLALQKSQSIILANADVTKTSLVTHNLVGDREIVPLPATAPLFNSYDAAMKYAWRPICSLDEYVIFHDSAGEGRVPASGAPSSLGAVYYDRIRRLTPSTSDVLEPPNVSASGLSAGTSVNTTTTQAAQPASSTSTAAGLNSTFAQTRANWDKALLAYRANVRSVKAPRT